MRSIITRKRRTGAMVVGIAALVMAGPSASHSSATVLAPPAFQTTPQDVGPDCATNLGNQGVPGNIGPGGISADGNLVAFASNSDNLVTGDTNNQRDVFVHNNTTGCTTRVSVDSAGNQGNGVSSYPGISADGTKVSFGSVASNLVTSDTNGVSDAFVHNLVTGVTSRVSVSSTGVEGNSQSSDVSGTPPDSSNGTVPMRSAISANGNVVAFPSWASNLVASDTNGIQDIFVHNMTSGVTTRASVDSAGNEVHDPDFLMGSVHPALSKNGNVVTFTSWANDLVTGDTNGVKDVFLRDLVNNTTERINVNSNEEQAEGGVIDFGTSDGGRPSADGRYVAFGSGASNLVVPDTNTSLQGYDVYLRDRVLGVTTLESVSATGSQGQAVVTFGYPDLSDDASVISFASDAPNLVPGDTNAAQDIFVRVRATGKITRTSVSSSGAQSVCSATCGKPDSTMVTMAVTQNKVYTAYTSRAENFAATDTNNAADTFRTKCSICL